MSSSYNPNLPLRMFQYSGNLYEKYIKQNRLNKYGTSLLKLPIPKLYDFLIKTFLETHKAEVKGMLLTEYNEAETMEMFREEGRKKGRGEGEQKMLALIMKMQAAGDETIFKQLASDPGELEKMYRKYGIE